MNKEVKELIDRLKNDSDCKDVYWVGYVDGMNCDAEITSKEINLLLDYINQLETKINTYENPEDMTLMFMWCDEKAKDKIKELKEKLNQLETNRDEALNLMEKCKFDKTDKYIPISEYKEYQELKAILERGKEDV